MRSIDPRRETRRRCQRPVKVADLFGTRVAETILASVHVRTQQKAGHMNASDLIKIIPKSSCEKGAVHIWHLDEVYLKINGRLVYLWRAVDAEGEVLDVLIQKQTSLNFPILARASLV